MEKDGSCDLEQQQEKHIFDTRMENYGSCDMEQQQKVALQKHVTIGNKIEAKRFHILEILWKYHQAFSSFFFICSAIAFAATTIQQSFHGKVSELDEVEQSDAPLQEDDTEPEDEFHFHPIAAAIALFSVVSGLLLLTVLFEKVKSAIEESAKDSLKPIVNSLFSELSVLGFISLVSFCIMKTGFLYGVYAEILEEVHYTLFGIMVLYIVLVLFMIKEGRRLISEWKNLNLQCQHADYEENILADCGDCGPTCGVSCQELLGFYSTKVQALRFSSLRKEFILNRQLQFPYETATDAKGLPEDFDYGRYLALCFGKTVAKTIELTAGVWLCVWLLCVFSIGLLILYDGTYRIFAWTFASLSYVNAAALIVVNYKADDILTRSLNLQDFPEEYAKNHLPEDQAIPNKPLWTLQEPRTNCFSYLMCHCYDESEPQDSIYWGNRQGEEVFLGSLRFHLLFMAISLSVICGILIKLIYFESGPLWAVAFGLYGVTPTVFVLLGYVGLVTCNIVHATSIGWFRKNKEVAKTVRWQKTQRATSAMVLMNNMALFFDEENSGAENWKGSGDSGKGSAESRRSTESNVRVSSSSHDATPRKPSMGRTLTDRFRLKRTDSTWGDYEFWKSTRRPEESQKIKSAEEVFQRFDYDHTGMVERDELVAMLTYMGVNVSDEQLEALMRTLDNDQSGDISQEEFVRWHMKTISKHAHKQDARSLATQLFRRFDKEQKGIITTQEFKEGLEHIGATLTDDEINDLIRELDENNDLHIDLEEFITLLTRYSD